jgi:subtilisin family serine protease
LSRSTLSKRAWLGALSATALTAAAATLPGSAHATAPHQPKLDLGAQHLSQPPSGRPAPRAATLPSHGRSAFLLTLDTRSTMSAFRSARASEGKTAARTAARDQLSSVRAAQNAVIGQLPAKTPVLYRTHALLAGLGVTSDVANLDVLKQIPGVAHVYPIAAKTASNAYAMPLQGAPAAWTAHGDLGQNTTIAVIDTGIDYTHANFGGPGTAQAYQDALAADDQPADPSLFPSDKVIGGFDLAGDDYDADPGSATYQPNPHPDSNPLDCAGHGSHVAGTAAGLGENSDGSTYAGSYDNSTPFDSLRIGPGMAPDANLYAFKVFGCEGSTDVVAAAIDMAADPNGDGDPSDHADVINMSLGADYGSAHDGDSVASNAAVDAGITVAVASGNGGDYQDVGGSPGDAAKVISVANSQDASNVIDTLHVSAPVSIAGSYGAERSVAYDWANDPDLAGDLAPLTQPDNLDGCDPLSTADAAAVAGKVAFLEWTDGPSRRCGSVARSGNVAAAGAIGFVFADDEEAFSAGITGSATIPGVMVTKSAGDTIRTELTAGHTVTVSGTSASDFALLIPGDNDKINSSSSRGIHATGNVKPDVTAVGTSVFSTAVGTGNQGVSFTGTSMATPMVAGLSSLVIGEHPDWTPEQVKADIMNTAGQDIYTNGSAAGDKGFTYAPNRVGAGRIEADKALDNSVLAYNADDPGSVSVSFGPVQVSGATTLTKQIRVQNTALQTRVYDVSYDPITSVSGVDITVSPSTVTLAPRSSQTVTVTLSAPDPTALTKTVDPTIGRTSALGDPPYPRDTLSDASGRVLVAPESGPDPTLRVPVYAAPRPASTMRAKGDRLRLSGQTHAQTGALHLSGQDLGQSGHNGTGNADADDDIVSLAAGFELAANDPAQPACSASVATDCLVDPEEKEADIRHVGVTSDAPLYGGDPNASQAYFAITARGAHSIPADHFEYDVYLDVDGDHQPDLVAYNTRLGSEDVFVTNLYDLATNEVVDTELSDVTFGDVDRAIYDSDVLVMPVWLNALAAYGVNADSPRINYGVVSFSNLQNGPVDSVGIGEATGRVSLSANVYKPGVSVTDSDGAGPLVVDRSGADLQVTRNGPSYRADGGRGLLLVHFHNRVGNKAQVVTLVSTPTVTLAASAAKVSTGQKVRLTVHVTDPSGAGQPTGSVKVVDRDGHRVAKGLLRRGAVTMVWRPGKAGTFQLTARYGGDASYRRASSSEVKVKVT